MNLQELIEQSGIDINEGQIRAFFLGAQTGDKPLSLAKTMDELLADVPEVKKSLEPALKKVWDEISAQKKAQLTGLFQGARNLSHFLTLAQERLDFFLTGLSLAGFMKDKACVEVLEELENVVMDLDDYLAEGSNDEEAGEEIKDQLLGAWEEFMEVAGP